MNLSRQFAALGILALLALQWLWHAWLLPPERITPWLLALLLSLPIVPAAVLALLRNRQAGFWGGVAALFYFCHGISESWAIADAWPLGLAEAALSVWIIVAGSWEGMHARLDGKKTSGA